MVPTTRAISPYSVYPDEKEVLFLAGTQFQVLHRARPGLKTLLQAVMRCAHGPEPWAL